MRLTRSDSAPVVRYSSELSERLYYHDSNLLAFEGRVIWRSEDGLAVELDRTAFYPTSGGQPHDTGHLGGQSVVDVVDEGTRVIHRLQSALPGDVVQVAGQVDGARRLDHMRQHTGQHLLSAVLEEEFGLKTVSFHLGVDYATIDVEPQNANAALLAAAEARVNEQAMRDLGVSITFEHSSMAAGLRKAPDRDGLLRIVTIEGLDRSACGGTHVRRTGEIGPIVVGKTEKVRKALRIEFYCGPRALRYLRERAQDAEAQVGVLRERFAESDKQRRRLAIELAEIAGRRRFAETQMDAMGRKVWVETLEEINDEAKAMLNAFLTEAGTIAIFTGRHGGAILFGAHPSLGVDCGVALKAVVQGFGGKGGGSPRLAQGSVADASMLPQAIAALLG